MTDITTRRQKAIVEPGDSGVLIMHEDGTVESARTPRAAMKKIQARARAGNSGATVTLIEWRGGLVPPNDETRTERNGR